LYQGTRQIIIKTKKREKSEKNTQCIQSDQYSRIELGELGHSLLAMKSRQSDLLKLETWNSKNDKYS